MEVKAGSREAKAVLYEWAADDLLVVQIGPLRALSGEVLDRAARRAAVAPAVFGQAFGQQSQGTTNAPGHPHITDRRSASFPCSCAALARVGDR